MQLIMLAILNCLCQSISNLFLRNDKLFHDVHKWLKDEVAVEQVDLRNSVLEIQ